MSLYQKAVIDALENGEFLTIRQIMNLKNIKHTKNTYVISAVKTLLEQKKIKVQSVSNISNGKKTIWMDATISLN